MSVSAPERPTTRTEKPREVDIGRALSDTLGMLGEKNLPIFEKKDEIAELIRTNDVSVIEGETGSGKSTVTPILALAEAESRGQNGKVIVTQPRRVAAESLYKYLEPTMGERVGFRHGGGSSRSSNTQLEFAVERTLLNDIVKGTDPLLSAVDTVVIDEVHEGTVDSSILIAFLKQIQEKRRNTPKPLKLVLTSATLDKEKMISYFSDIGDSSRREPGHMKIEGKMFKVDEYFESESVDIRDVERVAAQKAFEVYDRGEDEPGDMLIFMPGAREIDRTIKALEELRVSRGVGPEEIEFITLRGGDESAESMKKLYEESTKRRVFVSTNVAETSVTIPSVRVVIDSGLVRLNVFDHQTGMSGLQTESETKSNARQRKGRAGRVSEGTVHYLFTRENFSSMHDFLLPEILRNDLTTQVLLMKELGIKDIVNFDFIDHPGKEKIDQAVNSLVLLGALNPDGVLSDVGKRMLEVNAEPRFARMIVEAQKLGVEEEVALVIGMIQNAKYYLIEKGRRITDSIYSKFVDPDSDILTRLRIWNEYVQHNSSKKEREEWQAETKFQTTGFYKAAGTRAEILRNRKIKDGPIDLSPERVRKIHQALAVGLVDNTIVRQNGAYRTIGGTPGVKIDDRASVLSMRPPEVFMSGNLRRTEKGPIYAGLNFKIDLKAADISAFPQEPASQESPAGAAEKTAENIAKEIEEQSVIDSSLKPDPGVQAKDTGQSYKEEEKKRQKGLRNNIRSFLRKLKLIK